MSLTRPEFRPARAFGRLCLWLLTLAAVGAPLRGNVAGGGNAGSDVTLEEKGDNVVLSNGIVSAVISKGKASVSSLRFRGQETVAGGIYYSMDGGANYRTRRVVSTPSKRGRPASWTSV